MAEIVLAGLVKRYDGDVLAVDGVSLAIEDGELMVLVGPSGCGKSTTLRMIAGLERITEGDLSIAGRRVNDVHPRDRDIAMVFQSYALYPHMTVRQNMAFGLTLRKLPRKEIRGRVAAAAMTLGISDLLHRRPRALSGGERQRVAMGRALVRSPSVFLFDEPLSNLDARLRVQMRVEIARLHRELATTMVYVTHDQVEAMTLADRIAIMDQGRLQQVGTPLEVYHHPANRFVAGFIGSPTMNFLDGHLEGDPAAPLFTTGDVRIRLPGGGQAEYGDQVTIGVRPEHVRLASEASQVRGTVAHVERMGAETMAHVAASIGTVVTRLAGSDAISVGDEVGLSLDPGSLHLFDPTGANVGPSRPGASP